MRIVSYSPLFTVQAFGVRYRSGEPWLFLPFQVSVSLEWTDSRAYYALG